MPKLSLYPSILSQLSYCTNPSPPPNHPSLPPSLSTYIVPSSWHFDYTKLFLIALFFVFLATQCLFAGNRYLDRSLSSILHPSSIRSSDSSSSPPIRPSSFALRRPSPLFAAFRPSSSFNPLRPPTRLLGRFPISVSCAAGQINQTALLFCERHPPRLLEPVIRNAPVAGALPAPPPIRHHHTPQALPPATWVHVLQSHLQLPSSPRHLLSR